MPDPHDYVEELFRKGLTPAEIVRYGCERRGEERGEALDRVMRYFHRQGLPLDREVLERHYEALLDDPEPPPAGEPPSARS